MSVNFMLDFYVDYVSVCVHDEGINGRCHKVSLVVKKYANGIEIE